MPNMDVYLELVGDEYKEAIYGICPGVSRRGISGSRLFA